MHRINSFKCQNQITQTAEACANKEVPDQIAPSPQGILVLLSSAKYLSTADKMDRDGIKESIMSVRVG